MNNVGFLSRLVLKGCIFQQYKLQDDEKQNNQSVGQLAHLKDEQINNNNIQATGIYITKINV